VQGPVVCILPDAWAHLAQAYGLAARRGLDARQAVANSVAMEANTVPYVEADGVVRIPQANLSDLLQPSALHVVAYPVSYNSLFVLC
jgi:hypothetical protein